MCEYAEPLGFIEKDTYILPKYGRVNVFDPQDPKLRNYHNLTNELKLMATVALIMGEPWKIAGIYSIPKDKTPKVEYPKYRYTPKSDASTVDDDEDYYYFHQYEPEMYVLFAGNLILDKMGLHRAKDYMEGLRKVEIDLAEDEERFPTNFILAYSDFDPNDLANDIEKEHVDYANDLMDLFYGNFLICKIYHKSEKETKPFIEILDTLNSEKILLNTHYTTCKSKNKNKISVASIFYPCKGYVNDKISGPSETTENLLTTITDLFANLGFYLRNKNTLAFSPIDYYDEENPQRNVIFTDIDSIEKSYSLEGDVTLDLIEIEDIEYNYVVPEIKIIDV
jgi:hypothetical protein